MFEMSGMGRALIILGAVLIIVGLVFVLGGKLPWFGKLPGDILVQKRNFTFFFPITTSILVSIILTIIFWFIGRR